MAKKQKENTIFSVVVTASLKIMEMMLPSPSWSYKWIPNRAEQRLVSTLIGPNGSHGSKNRY